ncbi:SOS response-associated peptidase family protein [Pantoea sp. LMR881]|uniref:SOS response-associated peptidase family protein n=1 Tax=Pantoea sp. LMR881 TaxID=3014336 RepID=UPI0022AEE7CE|nr:SOS response-associated peptidase family protein [Pantoea sp. LMR881]MCZ4058336.1 SOS response-associated peptidase family protein [Pantoea sp. LMR881]
MCGRFAQYSSRDDYFDALKIEDDELIYDPQPIGRYNVAPGTKVLLLNQRNEHLHLDPVYWGYGPEWWNKQPLINARGETAATGRMFKPLWVHGRAIVPADGWFEWKKEGDKKQPYFIYHKQHLPLFFAAIGKAPYNKEHGHEGFVIVTAASQKGMVDIHDRRPLVLTADVISEWLDSNTSARRAEEIAHDAALPEKAFTWHPVDKAVGSIKNQDANLINEITPD